MKIVITSSIIIIILILIGFFNPISQYIMAFNGDNRIKAENQIINNPIIVKKIVCSGIDLSVVDFENNKINDYYQDIRNLGTSIEAIGFFENKFYYMKNEPNESEMDINCIAIDFSNPINLRKVPVVGWNWIKVENGIIYFSNKNYLDLFSINDNGGNLQWLKKIYFADDLICKDAFFTTDECLIYISQNELKNSLIHFSISENIKEIIHQNTKSFCVYEEIIYFTDSDGNLYEYDISNKKLVDLGSRVQYTNEKYKVKQLGELIAFKDNKVFFITHHLDWEMPFNIISYYDLKERKIIDIANVIGAFTHFQIIFY